MPTTHPLHSAGIGSASRRVSPTTSSERSSSTTSRAAQRQLERCAGATTHLDEAEKRVSPHHPLAINIMATRARVALDTGDTVSAQAWTDRAVAQLRRTRHPDLSMATELESLLAEIHHTREPFDESEPPAHECRHGTSPIDQLLPCIVRGDASSASGCAGLPARAALPAVSRRREHSDVDGDIDDPRLPDGVREGRATGTQLSPHQSHRERPVRLDLHEQSGAGFPSTRTD